LTIEEARITGTTTLEVVYDLLKNMKMIMDGMHDLLNDYLRCIEYSLSHLDKSVLIRRTLGVFFVLSTLSLLTVVAVDMQQVSSNMNKSRRVFNPDL